MPEYVTEKPKTVCVECRHRYPLIVDRANDLAYHDEGDRHRGLIMYQGHWCQEVCAATSAEIPELDLGDADENWREGWDVITGNQVVVLTQGCREVNLGDCPHFEEGEMIRSFEDKKKEATSKSAHCCERPWQDDTWTSTAILWKPWTWGQGEWVHDCPNFEPKGEDK